MSQAGCTQTAPLPLVKGGFLLLGFNYGGYLSGSEAVVVEELVALGKKNLVIVWSPFVLAAPAVCATFRYSGPKTVIHSLREELLGRGC